MDVGAASRGYSHAGRFRLRPDVMKSRSSATTSERPESASVSATLRPMTNADDASPKGLDRGAVRHVAKLARLRLTDDQVERYQGQLESILGHISKLNAVDVGDVEPMAHPMPLNNRLAEDVPVRSMPIEALLGNAPAVEGRYLAVPKVLGEGSA